MATVEQLLAAAKADEDMILALKRRLSHATSYTDRTSINRRIRQLTDHLNALSAQYLRQLPGDPVTIFGTTTKPAVYAGISVRMDISLDGQYFSNPAPKIANGARVWVRAIIDIAQKSPYLSARTVLPEHVRCTWVIPKGWTSLDNYSAMGRVEEVVSIPLVTTREFLAPGSGTTKGNFGMFADPYYYAEAPILPTGALVETSTISAHLASGTYYYYTKTANVLSSRTQFSVPSEGMDFLVGEGESLFYTDGNTDLIVREILSGIYSGKYISVIQPGITLTEVTGNV